MSATFRQEKRLFLACFWANLSVFCQKIPLFGFKTLFNRIEFEHKRKEGEPKGSPSLRLV
jgi:hypothetical protein